MSMPDRAPHPDASVPNRPVPVTSPADVNEVSLLGLLNAILRHRTLVLAPAATILFAVVVVGLIRPRSYTASASFTPQSRRAPSSFAGLAAQFGLNVPGVEQSQSPAFYVELLKSREILRAVVETGYSVPSDAGSVSRTLIEVFDVTERDAGKRREAAIKRLRASIEATVSARTGVVNLAVKAPSASLADQIARRLLEELNRFNLETRQSQAAAERRFTERRLGEVKGELRAAEDRLQTFLQRNRDYRNSPELSFQQDRLARDVGMLQQVYTTLSQAYEQAKLEEVRDTPVLTVLEPPEVPARPDSRGLVKNAFLALVLGGMLGLLLALGREFMHRTVVDDPEEFERFAALKDEALNDLKHPLKAMGRAVLRH